ncbi:hypothetical protein [Azospirillum sp. sgz301742]
MFRSATLAAVIALTIAVPAWAQQAPAVSAEGAAAMRAAIADGLKRTFPEVQDGIEFRWSGQTQVTPAGDRYDVMLPALTIVSTEDMRFDIGAIQLKVSPKPDATYAVDAVLPTVMTMRNGKMPAGTLSIGRQRFTGVWSGAVENFVSADLAYGDLALVDNDSAALRIGSITATQDMRPDGPGTWSGPVAGALSDVTVTDAQKATLMKMAGIAVEANYGRIDLAKVSQFKALMATHAAAGTEPPATQFLSLLGGVLGEAVVRTRITGLTAGNDEGRVGVDLATFTMGVRDLDRETSSTVLGFQTEGLKIEPLPGPKQFMPQRFDVQISLGKLPNAAIGQALMALAALEEPAKGKDNGKDGGKLSGKAAGKAGMAGKVESGKSKKKAVEPDESDRDAQAAAIGMALVEAASKAGTELRIDHLSIETPATSGAVTGTARVASAAAMGAVGGAQIVLRGLDAAAKALQPKPGAKPEAGDQETLGIIAMLQAMGQQSTDEAGKDVRTYKIDLTESGQTLLNGADMSAVMGMGGQPAEPAPPVKKGGMSGKKN